MTIFDGLPKKNPVNYVANSSQVFKFQLTNIDKTKRMARVYDNDKHETLTLISFEDNH